MRFPDFISALALAALIFAGSAARAQTETMESIQVLATRTAPAPADIPVATDFFSAADLAAFPTVTLDDALRDDPSFSLFRRTNSLISNPTSQGVSLRGIGPSGASRSLVLLDGVPLNDPFGGWVLWSEVPRLSLSEAQIVEGGGSGVWGNSALAGSIILTEVPPAAGSGRAEAEAGAFSTYSGEVAVSAPAGPGTVSVDATDFSTGGFYDLLTANRGAVDRPLSSDHQVAELDLHEPISRDIDLVVTGRVFDENRGNGTVLTNNTSHVSLISALLDGHISPELSWTALAYVQRESFSAVFSSVSASRATETPSDDQYDVPATAAGGSLTAQWTDAGAVTEIGTDLRQVIGETREDLAYTSGMFTEARFAGGAQDFAGVFVHREQPLTTTLKWVGDARVDAWQNRDGHDSEFSLLTSAPTSLANYPTRTGNAFSPNLGLIWTPAPDVRAHAAAYHGFRLPTLNEYYRPYRVGNVTTDANPDLQVETLDGAEAGIDIGSGPWSLTATAFADEMYHSVGTVVLSDTAAGETVERQNLDEVLVRGAETRLRWKPVEAFDLSAGCLFDDSRVQEALAEPDLQGLRLPEVPKTTVTLEAAYRGPWSLTAGARYRWVSLQFDDQQNTLRLPGAGIVDFELSRRFGAKLTVYAAAENATNALVATSETTTGLYTYDAPRMLRAGARYDW